MATSLCHQNGRMEYWNAGILGIEAEINHFNKSVMLPSAEDILTGCIIGHGHFKKIRR